MSKTIVIKLTKSGPRNGPFDIYDQLGEVIDSDVSKSDLIIGVAYVVDDDVVSVTLTDSGVCTNSVVRDLGIVYPSDLTDNYTREITSCLWSHLTDVENFNKYYGNTEPYIIEYPFVYQYQDEILQNVKDYTKVFKYIPDGTGVFNSMLKIETDDYWFNKAVVYNGQQSSGILELVPKPLNDLQAYMSYPQYSIDKKTILFTKSDNFYQYNTFWSIVNDKSLPLFIPTCESLSIDKVVNQDNMDYTYRSFNKEPLRAKDLRVRHMLTDRSNVHLVSQFILTPAMISYK